MKSSKSETWMDIAVERYCWLLNVDPNERANYLVFEHTDGKTNRECARRDIIKAHNTYEMDRAYRAIRFANEQTGIRNAADI